MIAPIKRLPKHLSIGLWCLIGLEVGLALAYLITIWRQQSMPAWLDWNGLRSLPSLMQAAALFTIGLLALLLLIFRNRIQRPLSRLLPLSLASLCFYGAVDELTKLHLQLNQYNWKGIYITILIAIPLICWRDLDRLWREHRPIVLWVLIGLGIFLLGGFGAELIKENLHTGFSPGAPLTLTEQNMSLPFWVEPLRITLEEFAELLGETIILFGVAQFVLKRISSQAN
ncbi:hypothetical protein [Acaryochloris sp. IP29b_bin.137]|uniref:hypothetical protein n=1 Tax=Acaryochloris sp. IP29b_bin.137 TaxID=2969217 RepID=UPI0026258640|nr:hypothetical protein [Acaryochloris sp. IP29b_bin.137]